jgi:hypothetical protein
MALRIGGAKRPPVVEEAPVEEQMPVEEAPLEEEVPMEEPMAEEAPMEEEAPAGGPIDPMTAGYKGPESGPFMCGNCVFFQDGTCALISGPVEESGLCNLFTPLGMAEEEAPAEEAPVEEMPPAEEEVTE